jgi:multiple sugar transport system permease protein
MVLIPLFWTFLNGFKYKVDIISVIPKIFFTPTLDNFIYVITKQAVYTGLLNSIIVTGISVLLGGLLGLPTAYALARYPNKWTNDIQFFVLSLRFLPPVAVAIPIMIIWLKLGLYDTRLSLIITYLLLSLSSTVWLSVPAFKQVPIEVEEAALVDGYNPYEIFLKIALPVAYPSLIGALAFSFVLIWNEFMIALMLTTTDAQTLPVVASGFTQMGRNVPWGILNASVIVLSIPPLLFLGLLSTFLDKIIKKSLGGKISG